MASDLIVALSSFPKRLSSKDNPKIMGGKVCHREEFLGREGIGLF